MIIVEKKKPLPTFEKRLFFDGGAYFACCKVVGVKLIYLFFYPFLFLLTINLKLIIVHVEIKIVNKEAATKRSTLLHAQLTFL